MEMEDLKKLTGEVEEKLEDIEHVLQMLELSLEMNEDEEWVRRSVKIIRKMVFCLLEYATSGFHSIFSEENTTNS